MQRLMGLIHRIYIWRLSRELAAVKRDHRFHTQDIKQLYALDRRVQSDTQNTYPQYLLVQLGADVKRYEALIATEADTIKELQAEIKAEKKKGVTS